MVSDKVFLDDPFDVPSTVIKTCKNCTARGTLQGNLLQVVFDVSGLKRGVFLFLQILKYFAGCVQYGRR